MCGVFAELENVQFRCQLLPICHPQSPSSSKCRYSKTSCSHPEGRQICQKQPPFPGCARNQDSSRHRDIYSHVSRTIQGLQFPAGKVILLFPDAPTRSDENAGQALLQCSGPDVAVKVDAKYQSVLVDPVVRTRRLDNLSIKALQEVLVWLGKARFLVETLDGLAGLLLYCVPVSIADSI